MVTAKVIQNVKKINTLAVLLRSVNIKFCHVVKHLPAAYFVKTVKRQPIARIAVLHYYSDCINAEK